MTSSASGRQRTIVQVFAHRVLRSEDFIRLRRELTRRGQRCRLSQRQRRLEGGLGTAGRAAGGETHKQQESQVDDNERLSSPAAVWGR